jgi:hypothetical protein
LELSKNTITYIALVVALIVIAYLISVLHVFGSKTTTSSTTVQSTTTTPTTVLTTTSSSTTTSITANYVGPCNGFEISNGSFSATLTGHCMWPGGSLGLWSATGNAGRNFITVAGANGTVYFNASTFYNCTNFIRAIKMPPQEITVMLKTGSTESGSCGPAIAKFNTTTSGPLIIYKDVFNGAFSTGQYTGWNESGAGFGEAPLNLTWANAHDCYLGPSNNTVNAGWNLSSYSGTFVATTFTCGLTVSPGNLTSSLFNASEPFLDFKILSPDNAGLYVEVMYNKTAYITANYDTFNVTKYGATGTYTFRNASIPLVSFIGEPVSIRVVAQTLQRQTYIAVGDFRLSNTPPPDNVKPVALNSNNA